MTPNHHKLVNEFVLLDNFYCSGVVSADGHSWADSAYVTDYLEKAFGAFPRSYPDDGRDALAFAPTGFCGKTHCCTAKRSATTANSSPRRNTRRRARPGRTCTRSTDRNPKDPDHDQSEMKSLGAAHASDVSLFSVDHAGCVAGPTCSFRICGLREGWQDAESALHVAAVRSYGRNQAGLADAASDGRRQ